MLTRRIKNEKLKKWIQTIVFVVVCLIVLAFTYALKLHMFEDSENTRTEPQTLQSIELMPDEQLTLTTESGSTYEITLTVVGSTDMPGYVVTVVSADWEGSVGFMDISESDLIEASIVPIGEISIEQRESHMWVKYPKGWTVATEGGS